MIYKQLRWITIITVSVTLAACGFCNERDYCCDAFDDENLGFYIHQEVGDTLVFANPSQQIRFQVDGKRKTKAYIKECRCSCQCTASGELHFACIDCDSSLYKTGEILIQRSFDPGETAQVRNNNYSVTFDFLGLRESRSLSSFNSTKPNYIEQINLNDSVFYNVFTFERDTNQFSLREVNNNTFLPWKIYVNTKGILGFEDFQTKSTYVYK